MSINKTEITIKKLEESAEEYERLKIIDNAHERAILSEKIFSKNSPRFEDNLDYNLYYTSYFFIYKSIKLLDNNKHQKTAKKYLKDAAESLEFLSKSKKIEKTFKDDIIFNSILAYYISGNYPRSFVLTNENNDLNLPEYKEIIFKLLNKDFDQVRATCLRELNSEKYDEEKILMQLKEEKIDEIDAISKIISYSIFKACNELLNFIKIGKPSFIEDSLYIIDLSKNLAQNYKLIDSWWLLTILNHLISEFHKNSLWNQLEKFRDQENSEILDKYIDNHLEYDPSIIELWPSQIKALPFINKKERDSFCLKMPTSAGKTQVAELTILRSFLDEKSRSSKVIYIAPFRSLATEIEKKLKNSLGGIGFRVSEIYGGFEINPSDQYLINDTDILVLTPEKFDAILRYFPEIKKDIALIIIDEGHIIGSDKRGLKFEFFIQRLKKMFQKSRFLFISGVLPNIDEFSEWIAESRNNFIESDWRPSRLMIGELIWEGKNSKIIYKYKNRMKFDQKHEINFIEEIKIKDIPNIGQRRSDLPHFKNEALGLCSLELAQESTTLVYAPQKSEVVSLAKVINKIIDYYKSFKESKGEFFDLCCDQNKDEFERLKIMIKSRMSDDKTLINCLENGFLIHHGDLPHDIKFEIENLVRSNKIKLIIATTTLAHGVNLPIKNVLIKGIHINKATNLKPSDFWNICGRAGRGGKENEGRILFFIDKNIKENTPGKIKKMRKDYDDLIKSKAGIESGLKEILNYISEVWIDKYHDLNVSQLCNYLANNSLEWVPNESKEHIESKLDIIDAQLVAISEEISADLATPELLEKILANSLLLIQCKNEQEVIRKKRIIMSRLSYLNSNFSPEVKKRIYKLGLNISDCNSIESDKDYLNFLFKKSANWNVLLNNEKVELLLDICAFIFDLKGIVDGETIPNEWDDILYAWLMGSNTKDMVKYLSLNSFVNDQTKLSLFIEKSCVNILPWGISSILSFLELYNPDKLPSICYYFSGMLKYGTIDPITITLMPYLENDRDLAIKVAKLCPHTVDNISKVMSWFKEIDVEYLVMNGIDEDTVQKIIFNKNKNFLKKIDLTFDIQLSSAKEVNDITVDDLVIIKEFSDKSKSVNIFLIDGTFIGMFEAPITLPRNIFPNKMFSVKEIIKFEEKTIITIITI